MGNKKAKCPECGSDNIRVSGPYGKNKPEGQPADKTKSVIYFYCRECENKWEEVEK